MLFSVRYDWLLLCTIVTLGYTGFMAYIGVNIVLDGRYGVDQSAHRSSLLSFLPPLAFILLAARFAVERAPVAYYLYAVFPAFFWHQVFRQAGPLIASVSSEGDQALRQGSNTTLSRLVRDSVLVLVAIEAMAYGYSDRRAFAAIAYGMGMSWPTLMLPTSFKVKEEKLLQVWRAVMALVGVFPLLPVEKGESLLTMYVFECSTDSSLNCGPLTRTGRPAVAAQERSRSSPSSVPLFDSLPLPARRLGTGRGASCSPR